ncbi:hypothetical protein AAC387_Pa08g1990 [Persea americana]
MRHTWQFSKTDKRLWSQKRGMSTPTTTTSQAWRTVKPLGSFMGKLSMDTLTTSSENGKWTWARRQLGWVEAVLVWR